MEFFMTNTVCNIFHNAFRGSYFQVMAHKIWLRIGEHQLRKQAQEACRWCIERVENDKSFAKSLAPELWQESLEFCTKLEQEAKSKLGELGMELGGGGHYPLLYFLIRLKKPAVVLETGVAAGFSSQAFLVALHKNGLGILFSSDFPYFRLKNPERYIGYLVHENLRSNWELYIEGDKKNLEKILPKASNIDFFCYDSDKSYSGRKYVLERVSAHLSPNAIIIMDDIQDNFFFRDYVEAKKIPYRVFEFHGKFVGIIGI